MRQDDFFNPSSFLDYFDELNTVELIRGISDARHDDDYYREFFQQPLLLRRPEAGSAIAFLRAAIETVVAGAHPRSTPSAVST
jgi:hypothetical protein